MGRFGEPTFEPFARDLTQVTATPDALVDSSRAWVSAVGASIASGLAFGTVYSFGTFFDAMATEFNADRGSTALIFAVTLVAFFGFGIVSGPRADRDGPHPLLLSGAALHVGGLLYTSWVETLWVGTITYAVGVGIGGGCLLAPMTAATGLVFDKRRAAALGLVAMGSGVGTLVLVPLSESLIATVGWRSAYRWLAVIALVGYAIAALALVRPPSRPAGPTTPGLTTAEATTGSFGALMGNPTFRSLFGSALFMAVPLLSAFAFIVPFATDNGLSAATAARVFSIVGLSSIFGRIALTSLAGRLGPVRLYQLTLALQPIAYIVWFFAGGSVGLLVVFAVILGTTYGGFVAITPVTALALFGGANSGRLMGVLFLAFGIGGLLGPPIAGWLADARGQGPVIIAITGVVLVAIAVSWRLTPSEPVPATS